SVFFRSGVASVAPRYSAARKRGFRTAIRGLPVLSLAALGAVPVNVALLRFPSFSIARTKKSSIILSPFYQILV
ncbi:MAG: hypothetical protein IJQ33_10745, partial [Clostridia bacterium]|nr:hypothetical protein [Clostridia bacterium]